MGGIHEVELDADALSVADKDRRGFLLAEFQSLRKEIDLQIAERRKIESQVVLGVAAVYSWLLTRDASLDPSLIKAGFILPVVVTLLGFVRWSALMMTVMNLGKYLHQVEGILGHETDGWERFLRQKRKTNPFTGQSALYWIHTSDGLVRTSDPSIWSRLLGDG
jgi:hypothetical protein